MYKTAEEFYRDKGYPDLDKFDKKADYFTYYELLEFAEQYANAALQEAAEKARVKRRTEGEGFQYEVDKESILSLIPKEK